LHAFLISAIQSPSSTPVTSSRVVYDAQRTHSTFLIGSGLQRIEKPRFSRELPHFLLSNQKLCKIFDLVS
jgi:hypothetical protein